MASNDDQLCAQRLTVAFSEAAEIELVNNPGPATGRREPRIFNRETLSPARGPRLLSILLSKIGRWLTGADQLKY